MLHATAHAARALGLRVLALHVHHGLSRQADAWWQHAAAACGALSAEGWPVQFVARRVSVTRRGGESLEARARDARYAALAEMARSEGCTTVLLAHHRRDQAETFLLQALRGAGPAGLSAMPRQAERNGITWLRPWLDLGSDDIAVYVRRHRIAHIEDDTNADTRLARNRLRCDVWPALLAAFPDAEQALALSARWSQEAWAGIDAQARVDRRASGSPDLTLSLREVLALGEPRARHLLRHWLRDCSGRVPGSRAFDDFWRALQSGGASRRWQLGAGGEVRLWRGKLSWHRQVGGIADVPSASTGPRIQWLPIRRAGSYAVPAWSGRLQVRRVPSEGVPLAALTQFELRPRGGGEQFQVGARRVPRALKKQYQAAGVPAWLREGPLGFVAGQLVFVPGLGIDARAWAASGEPQVQLTWIPDDAP